MSFNLNARLFHLEELRVLALKLDQRAHELKRPILQVAETWASTNGELVCCSNAYVRDMATIPIDEQIHFEWGCEFCEEWPPPFLVPIEYLEALLDSTET